MGLLSTETALTNVIFVKQHSLLHILHHIGGTDARQNITTLLPIVLPNLSCNMCYIAVLNQLHTFTHVEG
jgi:hypothetical protein